MSTTAAALNAAAPAGDAPARQQLSLARKLGFTVGDYSCNVFWQSMSLFLLFFYTDVVWLPAAAAGFIYMVASIVDAAIDPVMGAIADRTRSRYGRYRPYILFGALPLAGSFLLLYYKPGFTGMSLIVWLLFAHVLFRTCYTVVSIPFTSLNARVTNSSSERSTLAGLRMIFAVLAALTVASTTRPLVTAFGGADGQGYLGAAAVLAVVATVILPIVFLSVREPPLEQADAVRMRFSDYWISVRDNRAFWIVMIVVTCAGVCATALNKSVLYYFKYYLQDEASAGLALSLNAAAGLLIIPAWMVAARYIDKRRAWQIASVLCLAGLTYFLLTDIRSSHLMMGFLVYMQVGVLGLFMTFWSMLPDTVEYGEWRSGLRAESFIFGLGQFFLKVALGLGAGLFGLALDLAGYVPNVPQSAGTLLGIKHIMIVLPAIGFVLGLAAMYFYPMQRGAHEAIVEELLVRRRAVVSPDAGTR